MKKPMRVAVTGAAGQIGYSLLFRIASGEMLGEDQPLILQLLEIPDEKAQKALTGVMMELEDCAFPLLAGMTGSGDPKVAFKDADVALLLRARPRGPEDRRRSARSRPRPGGGRPGRSRSPAGPRASAGPPARRNSGAACGRARWRSAPGRAAR